MHANAAFWRQSSSVDNAYNHHLKKTMWPIRLNLLQKLQLMGYCFRDMPDDKHVETDSGKKSYLMESKDEAKRLDIKTDPDELRQQATWCNIRPGTKVLDVGCGPGRTTSILHSMLQPGGSIVGVDFSEERVSHAKRLFGNIPGVDFKVRDFTKPMDDLGSFDIVWVRFVLEYFKRESPEIVRNLISNLNPDGQLCLLDLDYNCLNHYELPSRMNDIIHRFMERLEERHNFDPYAGRKLYSYLFDLGFRDIEMNLMAHHLIYGEIRPEDEFNWIKKLEVASSHMRDIFNDYPGGYDAFFTDFKTFFHDPRRFTYTPIIMARGKKPLG